MRAVCLTIVLASFLTISGCKDERACHPAPVAQRAPVPITDVRLDNAFAFTETVWGGAEPHDENAFKALKEIGVKTILSVDGARPNVELAAKHGLRYVHLPIGYDEVPRERAREIAKLFIESSGPIFVHCHHGKHRSPAALATACVVASLMTHDDARLAMKAGGTGENYTGLWDSARNAQPVARKELKAMQVRFVERAAVPPQAEVMVAIDHLFSNLQACQKSGWLPPKSHPDIVPARSALELRELFSELMRTPEHAKKQADYKRWMESSEAELKMMELLLRSFKESGASKPPPEIDLAFQRLGKSCTDCHAVYRNVKRKAQ